MIKNTSFAFAVLAAVSLAACGHSEDASVGATADTVEVPADEAMVEATAMPVEMATGVATEAASASTDTAATAAATEPVAKAPAKKP